MVSCISGILSSVVGASPYSLFYLDTEDKQASTLEARWCCVPMCSKCSQALGAVSVVSGQQGWLQRQAGFVLLVRVIRMLLHPMSPTYNIIYIYIYIYIGHLMGWGWFYVSVPWQDGVCICTLFWFFVVLCWV